MKTYRATRDGDGDLLVSVDGKPLDPRYDLRKHSQEEYPFDCGHVGCGSDQLALALLADHLGDDEAALNTCRNFKWDFVANLNRDGWTIRSEDIDKALGDIASRLAKRRQEFLASF